MPAPFETDDLGKLSQGYVRPKSAVESQDVEKDNWKHRSASMRCQTCMFFVLKYPSVDLGRCRRHAPTMAGFPAVFTTDWCGDHKLDEERVRS